MTAPTGADIVACARGWLGTPFRHQGRLRGVGADCGGLIGGVAVECGIVSADWWERVFDPALAGYARTPHDGSLQAVLARFMTPIEPADALPGDVIVMHVEDRPRRAAEPHHVGILANYALRGRSLIHAMSLPPACVVEHRLAPPWSNRVIGAFRYPGVAPE